MGLQVLSPLCSYKVMRPRGKYLQSSIVDDVGTSRAPPNARVFLANIKKNLMVMPRFPKSAVKYAKLKRRKRTVSYDRLNFILGHHSTFF